MRKEKAKEKEKEKEKALSQWGKGINFLQT